VNTYHPPRVTLAPGDTFRDRCMDAAAYRDPRPARPAGRCGMSDMTTWAKCPGCDGRGEDNAMSGCHLPYRKTCGDCKGSGRVTEAQAAAIRKRHADWLKRATGS